MHKNGDKIINSVVIILIFVGLLMVFSSSINSSGFDKSAVIKQALFAIFGFSISVLISKLNFEMVKKYIFILYAIINILLVFVLFMPKTNGASSWFRFAGVSIQPSEFAKIIIILGLAQILSGTSKGIVKYLKAFAYIILPFLLILMQPDFGTGIVIIGIFLTMLFFSGIRYRLVIAFIFIMFVLFGVGGYYFINGNNLFFSEYQANRIRVFLNPMLDPYGSGYNALKARQAVGSGKLLGMGYLKGIQNQLGNIPEKTTDFIFAVIGEELGFIGCVCVVILFAILFIRLLLLSTKRESQFEKLFTIGVFTMLFIHVIVNIGMNIGLVPITGIPLPFISYGGSAMLVNIISVCFISNVW